MLNMIDIKKLRCGSCGTKGTITMTNVKGKSFIWKSYDKLRVLVDCEMPCCSQCGEMICRVWAKDSKRLDDALEKSETIMNQ
jgi:hypothetical protein